MNIFSIFAPRSRPSDVAPVETPVDPAKRVADIFGVPEYQLTPQVRTAFNMLINEVDSLRLDVEQLQLSLAEAEASADHDALAPVYNRRAFVREASRVLAMVKRHEIEASLERTGGDVDAAALELEVSSLGLKRRLHDLGLR